MSLEPSNATKSIQNNHLHPDEDEIDLLEFLDVLWSGRKTIAAVVALFTVGAIVYSLHQTEIYRAEVLLAPVENRQSSSPLASQLGGAAALVGINLGQPAGGRIASVLATLRSREFILKFIDDFSLKSSLFETSADGAVIQTDLQVYRKFRGILNITRNSEDGLIRLAIEWTDPVKAAEWANLIVAAINAHEKMRDVNEASGAIDYLTDQLASTQLVEMQRVFYQLIEAQTRVIMLADVRDEYVFRVIDPAVVPDERISPKRRAMVVIGLLIGMAISIIFVVFRYLCGWHSHYK